MTRPIPMPLSCCYIERKTKPNHPGVLGTAEIRDIRTLDRPDRKRHQILIEVAGVTCWVERPASANGYAPGVTVELIAYPWFEEHRGHSLADGTWMNTETTYRVGPGQITIDLIGIRKSKPQRPTAAVPANSRRILR